MTDQDITQPQDCQEDPARGSDSLDTPTSIVERREPRGRPQGTRQQNRSSNSRQFLFIDASTARSTSSEAVRVHVMREAHRSRRERQGSQSQHQSQLRRTTAQDEMVILDPRDTSRPPSATAPNTNRPGNSTNTPITASVIDWVTVVRTGASQSSLDSAQELQRLAEGYLRSVRLVQPDVLHLCRGDPLSLSAYLALAALQLASNEHEPANVASVQFETRALELLRSRIRQADRMQTDTTIISVLLLSQLEQHKANAEAALFHRAALQKLIQDRGGLEVLREQNHELFGILLDGGFIEGAS